MASTDDGEALTEAHRVAQRRVGVAAAASVLVLWESFDVDDVEESGRAWLAAAVGVVLARFDQSTALAVEYLRRFREIEAPDVDPFPAVAAVASPQRVRASMAVTGIGSVQRKVAAGESVTQAVSAARGSSSAAALRLSLAGGRETIVASAAADPAVQGWQRVTDGNPCAFCATLAINGAVTSFSGPSAGFRAHDGCGCTAEPVYSLARHRLPPAAQRLKEIYNESTAGAGTGEQLNAFRRALAAGARVPTA